jgi:hypothetical protein
VSVHFRYVSATNAEQPTANVCLSDTDYQRAPRLPEFSVRKLDVEEDAIPQACWLMAAAACVRAGSVSNAFTALQGSARTKDRGESGKQRLL